MKSKSINISFLLLMFIACLLGNSTLQAQRVNIIPHPQEIIEGHDSFTINSKIIILSSAESNSTAKVLQSHIKKLVGYQIGILASGKQHQGTINFKLDKNLAKEAYELIISKQGIQIIASNNTGWFYGVQTLIQLFPTHTNSVEKISSIIIPAVAIKDAPRFSWRAFMIDESRHFKGSVQVKLLLDEMAALKMNVFHWHLVDDQGWRIEIKKYPLLTQIGSKRKSTQVGTWGSPIQTGEPHAGFYTQTEIKAIVQYAKERHITVVPEIEMPGHSSAAIASYPWLGSQKKAIEVPTVFGVLKDVYDVADPKVYRFLTDVLDEVMTLFSSKVLHIGGDEVTYDQWKSSVTVQAYMKKQKINTPAELQVHFTNSIAEYLQSKGKRMMGWNEVLGHSVHDYQQTTETKSDQKLSKETVVQFWVGEQELITEAVSNGYDVVNSLSSSTYLDHDYNSIPLSKAYAFDPIPESLPTQYHNKVLGTGCQIWSEWIPTNGQMHFMVFPRIAAYAEVGWTEKRNKNFETFKEALKNFQKRWEGKGIYYAPDSAVEKKVDNIK
jgi:hexosaminidase